MLTAEENILLPLSIAGEKPDPAWFEDLIGSVGLKDRLHHRPAELSGGQQQRVAIARALVSRPSVIFADEPTGNLDSKTSGEILELLRHSVRDLGQTIVMVTHDARAAAIADRILFLADGLIVREVSGATAHDIVADDGGDRGRVTRFALKGMLGPQAAHGPDGARDRPRRRDGERHVRAHGLDRRGVQHDLHRGLPRHGCDDHRQDRLRPERQRQRRAALRRSPCSPRSRLCPTSAQAVGGVGGDAQLIGSDGKAITFGGAPNLGFSVDPSQPSFNSLTLVEGVWPKEGEVVIDKSTAGKKDLTIGQEIGVQAEGPIEKLRISGFVKFGSVSSIGGATLAGFTLPTAQRLFAKVGKLDQIRVAAKNGVSPTKLVAEIRAILPPGTQVRTGTAQAQEDAANTNAFISFLQKFLLAFGGIALFVGAFVIANSLSITIAQRTREFATLRTLGASRRQVLTSIVIEALVIGILASITGLLLGLGLAKGLFALFDAVGFTLPNSGLLFQTRTIIVSLLVGIIVTLLASLRPAHPGHAGAADRRRARGRDAARGTLRTVPHARLGAPHGGRLRSAALRDLRPRARHDQGAAVDGARHVVHLPRRRAALGAVRPAARRRPEPGRALDGLPLHRARLAVLPPSVLAPAVRRVGAWIDRASGCSPSWPAVS